ncbi:MAG: hypothetical protein GY832_41225, partial [Chloroflexi bacterium]|nr:hypothetical protein [Chloroflexota bacterium]
NNCCYASVAILLSYYGHQVSQQEAREQLLALQDDEGPFLRQFQLMSRSYKYPPASYPIRLLLANGIPVYIVQKLSVERPIGHCRVIHGYDDVAKEFISDDPLLGPDYRIRYGIFGWLSGAGGNFTAIYPPEMDALVQFLMSHEMKLSEWTKEW